MIPEDIRQTIDAALRRARAVSLRNNSDADKAQTLRVVAALQWLQQDAPQPLDFPDGPGWWAFEGRAEVGTAYFYDKTICRVSRMGAEYVADGNRATYLVKYMHGKWYRLSMPWDVDAQPTDEA